MFLLLYLTKNLLGIHWHRGSPCHMLLSSLSKEQAEKFWVALKPMAPEAFARQAIDKVAKNHALIIVPSWWQKAHLVFRLLPSLWFAWSKKEMIRSMRIFQQK